MMEKTEYAWKIKEYLIQNIQFADYKAGVIIALCTLNIGLFSILPDKLSTVEYVVLVISFIPILVSLFLAIRCVQPRLTSTSTNIIFWEYTANYKSYDEYKNAFIASDKLEEVLKQIFDLSKIASQKYKSISLSITWHKFGLVTFWIVIFLIKSGLLPNLISNVCTSLSL